MPRRKSRRSDNEQIDVRYDRVPPGEISVPSVFDFSGVFAAKHSPIRALQQLETLLVQFVTVRERGATYVD
jgi:hypothetical protein